MPGRDAGPPSGFVAGGARSGRNSPEYLTACAMIRRDVETEFAPLLAEARPLRRLRLRFRRWRRIRHEIHELSPGRGLYLK